VDEKMGTGNEYEINSNSKKTTSFKKKISGFLKISHQSCLISIQR